MKKTISLFISIFFLMVTIVIMGSSQSVSKRPHTMNPFWNDGEEFFDLQDITPEGIHHSILIAMDGSVLAFFDQYVRRSTDGGETWGPKIDMGASAAKSKVIDEISGDIFFFSTSEWYRSIDHGRTWKPDGKMADIENRLETLEVGGTPVFKWWPVDSELKYINSPQGENGIMLRYGKNKGRLIVPARVQRRVTGTKFPYPGKLDLNVVIYSDDGGRTWKQSDPTFPFGKDESAVSELSDGSIYHNSRNNIHHGNKHICWSYDGGQTWEDHNICKVLPDGPRSGRMVRNGHYGLMAGLVRLPLDAQDILIFSNVDSQDDMDASQNGRIKMTVWASFDGAKTWPVKRLIDEGPGDYSGLAAGRTGTESEGMIYLMYARERGQMKAPRIARFNLPWLIKGELTGDGKLPQWVKEKLKD